MKFGQYRMRAWKFWEIANAVTAIFSSFFCDARKCICANERSYLLICIQKKPPGKNAQPIHLFLGKKQLCLAHKNSSLSAFNDKKPLQQRNRPSRSKAINISARKSKMRIQLYVLSHSLCPSDTYMQERKKQKQLR